MKIKKTSLSSATEYVALVITAIVINAFVLFISYLDAQSNISELSNEIELTISKGIKKHIYIASVLGGALSSPAEALSNTIGSNPHKLTQNNKTKADPGVVETNFLFDLSYFVWNNFKDTTHGGHNTYMIDGNAENYLNVKDRNAVGKTTPTLHSDMVAYINKTKDELNKTDGLMVPEYFYSNVHINSDEQKRAVTIGVPVIKNLFSGKNHIVAGVMVFDVTDDDLKKVLSDMEQKSKATFDGYSIDMKSINTDDVNMPLVTNNAFLPSIKLKNEKIIANYHLSSKISFLGLLLPYKVVLIILNAAMMLYFLTYVKVKTNNVALMRKLSVDTLTKAVSREGGLMITNRIKKKDEFVLVLIDLDDFKPINDTYGHQAGDDALIHFSGFILDNIRSCDYLIRMGGDEFILLIKKGTLPGAYRKVTEIAEKIKPFQCMNDEIKLTFSFGMSLVEDDFMSSYKDADEQLYKMKRDKKSASRNAV